VRGYQFGDRGSNVERRASQRVSILAEHLKGPQNVHGVRKIDFLRNHQYLASSEKNAGGKHTGCLKNGYRT